MSFQKCPVCNGEGEILNPDFPKGKKKCGTCNGSGIINSKTGEPPHNTLDDKGVDDEIQKVLMNDIEK